MRDDHKIKAELLQELDSLRSRVSKLTQVEENLKQYQFMVESAHDAIFFKDLKSRYVMANNKALEAFGLSREQVIGKNDYEIMPNKDEAQKNIEDDNLVFKTGKLTEITKHMTGTDGKERWFQAIKVPQFDDGGNITGLIGIARDITDHKKAEDALRESEQRYRGVVDNIGIGVSVISPNMEILFLNKQLSKRCPDINVSKKPICYKNFNKPPREGICSYCPTYKTLKDGQVHEAITETLAGNKIVNDRIISSPIKDRNGKVIAAIEMVEDITERLHIEQALHESEEKFRSLVTNIPDVTWTTDYKGSTTFISPNVEKVYGYNPDEIYKEGERLWFGRIHPDDVEKVKEAYKALFEKGIRFDIEYRIKRKDGEWIWLHDRSIVTYEKDGVMYADGIFSDITRSRQREEELNKYRENMARAEQLASLGTLSATLAHELTQPLTVIGLSIGNSLAELEATSCPDTVIEELKEGLNEISSITSMVDRFRKFARMSNNRTVSEVDLKATAERIAKLLDESAWRAKVTLQVEGMDKLPHIYASEKDIEQLFFALVENAIQAADGKEKRQVIISGAVRDKNVELQFSDNCGGIAPENLDRIFEPFFTTRPEGEGTGLGLCIVQRTVSQLSGKVRVESEPGKGSTFFVTLPINIGEK